MLHVGNSPPFSDAGRLLVRSTSRPSLWNLNYFKKMQKEARSAKVDVKWDLKDLT